MLLIHAGGQLPFLRKQCFRLIAFEFGSSFWEWTYSSKSRIRINSRPGRARLRPDIRRRQVSLAFRPSHSLIVHVSNLCDRGEGTCTGSIMPNGGQNCPLKPKWYVLASMPIRKSVSAASQRVARQSALKLFTDRKHERELLRHFFERLARVQ